MRIKQKQQNRRMASMSSCRMKTTIGVIGSLGVCIFIYLCQTLRTQPLFPFQNDNLGVFTKDLNHSSTFLMPPFASLFISLTKVYLLLLGSLSSEIWYTSKIKTTTTTTIKRMVSNMAIYDST
jgi:hypothetical protein